MRPRRSSIVPLALALPLALLVAGCTAADDDDPPPGPDLVGVDQQNGACTAFEGRTFESVEQHECGLTPNGPAMCHWTLQYTPLDPQRSNYMWRYSDVGQSGSVRCTGRRVSTDGFGPVYTGEYDPATGRLTWQDVAYALP